MTQKLNKWLDWMAPIRQFAARLGVPDGHVYPIIDASGAAKAWYVRDRGFYRKASLHPTSWIGRTGGAWVARVKGFPR